MQPRTDLVALVRAIVLASVGALAILAVTSPASASDESSGAPGKIVDSSVARERGTYLRPFATIGTGMGLRFNNPYRLATPLGKTAESLSTTAPYFSLGGGVAFGDPTGWQHGPVLRWDFALGGVPQHVLVPSWGAFRRGAVLGGWTRFGLPILLSPDANMGVELAAGMAWYVRAGVGVTAELLGDLVWGAATPDNKRPAYPVLSGQLGALIEWEKLP
ncbi:MAG: hypothetical protein HYV09_26470 [Deltaproteobacteria bacterium]|nr:hypothetical protein [Deltaproteobacteria bacterium]